VCRGLDKGTTFSLVFSCTHGYVNNLKIEGFIGSYDFVVLFWKNELK
jgi:hypothetical protein